MYMKVAFTLLFGAAVLAQGATPPDRAAAIKELLAQESGEPPDVLMGRDDHDHPEG